MMSTLNLSVSPHLRSRLRTTIVMRDVLIALLPVTIAGIINFGLRALIVVLGSVATSVLTEYVFNYIAHRPNTTGDLSAAVTGLLLALVLPPNVPYYAVYAGAVFAILFVKLPFGGLGHNFMNPALAARCFLMLCFSTVMTRYELDGVSAATPLVQMGNGQGVELMDLLLGRTSGIIGCGALWLILGAIFLLLRGHISWEIPVTYIGSFCAFIALSGRVESWNALGVQVLGGGLLLGALFMATDPVTSPMGRKEHLLYGVLLGLLTGFLRIFNQAPDSVSYAIILGNVFVPLFDHIPIRKPFGYIAKKPEKKREAPAEETSDRDSQAPAEAVTEAEIKESFMKIIKPALILCAITIVIGAALGGVNQLTRPIIQAQQDAATAQSYLTAMQDIGVASATIDAALTEKLQAFTPSEGSKTRLNEVRAAYDAQGALAGYGVNVSNSGGFNGELSFTVGFALDGQITGICFTRLEETPGLGMRVDDEAWKAQFSGIPAQTLTHNKLGGSETDGEIDAVSGASTTSGAVVAGVNEAVRFYETNLK